MENYDNQSADVENTYDNRVTLDISISELKNFAGWATFKAVIDIISGALVCLGIITAAYGVPRILAGVKLLSAADELKRYISAGSYNRISVVLSDMHRYFKLSGISTIVKICFNVLFIIACIIFIVAGISKFPDLFNNMPGYNY